MMNTENNESVPSKLARCSSAAQIVSEICEALLQAAPEYSEVHECQLKSLLRGDISKQDERDQNVLDYMINNRRCHVVETRFESLNLAGYSLERVEKKLGKALGRAVFVHGLRELHLSGNSLRNIDAGLGWLVVETDNTNDYTEPDLSEIFVDSNIIRSVDWPPPAFAGISKCLTHVDLSKNKIKSIEVIPEPLPQPITLHALEWLDLSGNIGLEVLPDGLFRSMPSLKRFDAYSCALKAIPDDISGCTELRHCGLHSNELESVPGGLFQCDKLVWLSLNMNKIKVLPDGIANLKALERLSLHQNKLSTLPASIAECTLLEALSVHHNELKSLPDAIEALKNCLRLSLYENPDLCHVPDGVCGMSGLRELWLYDCGLASLNPGIANLKNCQKLWLDKNPELVLNEEAWAALKSLDLQELYLDGVVAAEEKDKREHELRQVMHNLHALIL